VKFSIIIPTYNHCDLLKECIEALLKFTVMDDQTEIIIVANGCKDETESYLKTLTGFHLKKIVSTDPLGFPKAVNMGLKAMENGSEYAVLLNDDAVLLNQEKNLWLWLLEELFRKDPLVGITGPLRLYENYVKQYYIQFFCAMIKREVIEKVGYIDEIFGIGNSEDADYCIRAKLSGFKIAGLPWVFDQKRSVMLFSYPLFHPSHKTVYGVEGFPAQIEKNLKELQKRYSHLPWEPFEKENKI
jgi:GT2 family glycosyltransferase